MEDYSTLITVLGWEERFLLSTNQILDNNNIKCVYLICFTDFYQMSSMEINMRTVKQSLKEKKIELKIINLEYGNSINNWKKLNDLFSSNNFHNVIMNITTFPRETIWTFLFFLSMNVKEVTYTYFKPESYDDNVKGLTMNHKSPRLLFKHSGIFDLNKELAVFIITGFDHKRTDILIEHYEPSKVVFLSQKGDQFENMKRNCGVYHRTAFKDIIIENIQIDSYDINHLYDTLYNLIELHEDYNIILTSQGPKTSAISTYLTYLKNKNIALAYVPAREFSTTYSFGCNNKPIIGTINYEIYDSSKAANFTETQS